MVTNISYFTTLYVAPVYSAYGFPINYVIDFFQIRSRVYHPHDRDRNDASRDLNR